MRRTGVGLAALATAVMSVAPMAQAQDRAAREFTMAGSWTLDAGEDYCQLGGVFRDGEDSISFALERNRAANTVRMLLVGDAVRSYRGAETITYAFLPAGEPRQAPTLRGEAGGRPMYNFGLVTLAPAGPPVFPPPPYDRAAELQFAAGVTGVSFDEGLVTPVRINTGSLRAPLQALQACMDDLHLYWGLDYQKHNTMTRPAGPEGAPSSWIEAGTISFEDFQLLSGGRNPIRVMISAEGRPTACHVHWPSLAARKNESLCQQIMANGRFQPALDADGQPMASYWMAEPFMFMAPPPGGRRG